MATLVTPGRSLPPRRSTNKFCGAPVQFRAKARSIVALVCSLTCVVAMCSLACVVAAFTAAFAEWC